MGKSASEDHGEVGIAAGKEIQREEQRRLTKIEKERKMQKEGKQRADIGPKGEWIFATE